MLAPEDKELRSRRCARERATAGATGVSSRVGSRDQWAEQFCELASPMA
jgi:hypothetical protein